ncbi:MAG: GNAT family N-acetyltransferase [Elusimicrobiales bacterium]
MDLLVRLYDVVGLNELDFFKDKDIIIKRPIGAEKNAVVEWVRNKFSAGWASECDVALSKTPPTCFIAVKNLQIVGFACYDATVKNFFGPIGVIEGFRKSGIGKALLIKTLKQMYYDGYAYAVIGWAGPVDFFKKTVGACEIEGSDSSVYLNLIKSRE